MLLAIDIGNTNVACGLFKGGKLVRCWRMPAKRCRSLSSTQGLLSNHLARIGGTISGVCVVSVVPALDKIFSDASQHLFEVWPLFATPRTIDIPLRRYPASQVGPDRLVNALAAYSHYHKACIVVDIGTAITFDVVNEKGEFEGGAIAPGADLMADALHRMTARLPHIKLGRASRALGKSTSACIRSGLYYGCAGLVDRIVEKISSDIKLKLTVIATGGGAHFLVRQCRTIQHIHKNLTLEGLKIIWKKRS